MCNHEGRDKELSCHIVSYSIYFRVVHIFCVIYATRIQFVFEYKSVIILFATKVYYASVCVQVSRNDADAIVELPPGWEKHEGR